MLHEVDRLPTLPAYYTVWKLAASDALRLRVSSGICHGVYLGKPFFRKVSPLHFPGDSLAAAGPEKQSFFYA